MTQKNIKFSKDVAWLRHTRTCYDKHYELMFDKDGNPTPLRKRINQVLGKILTGELDVSYLAGVKNEIKNAQKTLNHQKHLERMATKKPAKRKGKLTVVKMQKALLEGAKKYNQSLDNHKYHMLSYIGMRPKQLHVWRRMLPYYKGEKDGTTD